MSQAVLPAVSKPYLVRAGEGMRYSFAGQLAAVIARLEDTAGLFEGVIVSGGVGCAFPLHTHATTHEVLFVLDGALEFRLDDESYRLEKGDFASIPPGILHGYEMRNHRTQFLSWTSGGNGATVYSKVGDATEAFIFDEFSSREISKERLAEASESVDVKFAAGEKPARTATVSAKVPPSGVEAYVLRSREGERMVAGDQLFSFLAHRGNSNGAFIVVGTEGPAGEKIPEHYHEKHTEVFFCLEGKMSMWASGEQLELLPGDFLHVPANTVHAYRLDAHYTRFVGFLTPGLFEPFFRTLCDPYEGFVFPAKPRPFRFDRVLQKLGELDLKLVGPPRPQ